MTFVKWIRWHDDDKWPDDIKDPFSEKLKYWNKKHKLIIPDKDIEAYAIANNASKEEAKSILYSKNDKEPAWTDKKMADYWGRISDEIDTALQDYVVKNKIFLTDYDHQNQNEDGHGVPVFQDSDGNLYVGTYTLRSWSGLMAECWNKILGISSLSYIDIYCGSTPAEISKYLTK